MICHKTFFWHCSIEINHPSIKFIKICTPEFSSWTSFDNYCLIKQINAFNEDQWRNHVWNFKTLQEVNNSFKLQILKISRKIPKGKRIGAVASTTFLHCKAYRWLCNHRGTVSWLYTQRKYHNGTRSQSTWRHWDENDKNVRQQVIRLTWFIMILTNIIMQEQSNATHYTVNNDK